MDYIDNVELGEMSEHETGYKIEGCGGEKEVMDKPPLS